MSDEIKKQSSANTENFLEVDPLEIKNIDVKENINSTPYVSKMSKKARDYLKSIFEFEIRSIERTLNWDCSDWLPKWRFGSYENDFSRSIPQATEAVMIGQSQTII